MNSHDCSTKTTDQRNVILNGCVIEGHRELALEELIHVLGGIAAEWHIDLTIANCHILIKKDSSIEITRT